MEGFAATLEKKKNRRDNRLRTAERCAGSWSWWNSLGRWRRSGSAAPVGWPAAGRRPRRPSRRRRRRRRPAAATAANRPCTAGASSASADGSRVFHVDGQCLGLAIQFRKHLAASRSSRKRLEGVFITSASLQFTGVWILRKKSFHYLLTQPRLFSSPSSLSMIWKRNWRKKMGCFYLWKNVLDVPGRKRRSRRWSASPDRRRPRSAAGSRRRREPAPAARVDTVARNKRRTNVERNGEQPTSDVRGERSILIIKWIVSRSSKIVSIEKMWVVIRFYLVLLGFILVSMGFTRCCLAFPRSARFLLGFT